MKLSILVIFSFVAINLCAQKITTTLTGFKYKIKKEINIPKGIQTYNTAINTLIDIPNNEKQNVNKSRLNFPAGIYTYSDQNPDMTVSLEAQNFNITSIADNIGQLKQTDPVLYFNYKPLLLIKDKQGKVILKKHLTDTARSYMSKGDFFFMPDIKVLFGLYKNSPQEINKALMENEKYIGVTMLKASLNKASNFLSKGINDQVITYDGVLCSGKKGFDYTELDNAVVDANKAILGLLAFGAKNKMTPEQVGNSMNKLIPIWDKSLAEQDTTSENTKINKQIAKGLKLNLATAYFFIKDYNKALSFLDEIPESFKRNGELVSSGSFKGSAQGLRTAIDDFILFKENIEIFYF